VIYFTCPALNLCAQLLSGPLLVVTSAQSVITALLAVPFNPCVLFVSKFQGLHCVFTLGLFSQRHSGFLFGWLPWPPRLLFVVHSWSLCQCHSGGLLRVSPDASSHLRSLFMSVYSRALSYGYSGTSLRRAVPQAPFANSSRLL
jgi:hypothetical protein